MAEVADLVNNAQIASAPGHPIWPLMMARLLRQAAAGEANPLFATGPHVITDAFKVKTHQRGMACINCFHYRQHACIMQHTMHCTFGYGWVLWGRMGGSLVYA